MSRHARKMPRVRRSVSADKREIAKRGFDDLDLADVVAPRARREPGEFAARLIALQHRQQPALRRRDLGGDGLVVAVDELRRAGLAAQWRPAFPRVPVGSPRAVGEPLGDRVDALKPDAHLSSSARCRDRCPALLRCFCRSDDLELPVLADQNPHDAVAGGTHRLQRAGHVGLTEHRGGSGHVLQPEGTQRVLSGRQRILGPVSPSLQAKSNRRINGLICHHGIRKCNLRRASAGTHRRLDLQMIIGPGCARAQIYKFMDA